MSIIETFSYYLSYPFVQYALIVGVLIALCSSLFGVSLVLKRFSFIGDGLSHVAFGAMAIATVLNFSMQTPFIMIITIIAAVLLLRTGQNTKIKGDAAVAMFSVGSLAIGYLLMNVFSTSTNVSGDVCSTLFGSTTLLTLTKSEVVVCIIMSLLVVGFYIFFYNCKGLMLFIYLRMKYNVKFLHKIQNRKVRILEDCFSCFNLAHIQNVIDNSQQML